LPARPRRPAFPVADEPARQHRQPGRDRVPPRGELVPGRLQHVRAGLDEHDPCLFAGPREPRVVGQEAVPRMDRVRSGGPRRVHHGLHVQVRQPLPVRPDRDRGVRRPGRHRIRVRVRDREHGLDAEALAGADHPDGDLAAVGDQHPPDDHRSALIRISVAP
jgi:hypothetical protein